MAEIFIDREAKEVRLVLESRFYGLGAVLEAGADFSDACWVSVDGDKDDKLLVTLKPKTDKIDLSTVAYEFSNYVIGLMQNAIF